VDRRKERCFVNTDTEQTTLIFTCPWRWRQHWPPTRWYPTTILHGVITQKTTTWNITAMNSTSSWWLLLNLRH